MSVLKYRRDIDGLRAIAVTTVVLFHASVPGFDGGFVGVDIFFVISGYLITGILLNELADNRYTLTKFYERRMRRILPALGFMLLTATLFAGQIMNPDQMQSYLKSLAATSLFSANFYFWQSIDYFSPDAETNPLLHMWSLAVEEQFYVFFPLILAVLWRFARRSVLLWFIGAAVLSLVAAQVLDSISPTANFYLPIGRAWELLAGSIVAWLHRNRPLPSAKVLSAAGWIGALLVLASLVFVDSNVPFPTVFALPVVVGTALLLYSPTGPVSRVLGLAPLVWIGLISYSTYLWHQPLLAFANVYAGGRVDMLPRVLLVILSYVLGALSWRFVEQPFRKGFSARSIFALSGVVIVFFAALGIVGAAMPGVYRSIYLARLTPDETVRYGMINDQTKASFAYFRNRMLLSNTPGCKFRSETLNAAARARMEECRAQYGKGLMIVGDSHGIDIFRVVAEQSDKPFVVGIAREGCRLHDTIGRSELDPACGFKALFDYFAPGKDPAVASVWYTQADFPLLEKGRHVEIESPFHAELADQIAANLKRIAASVPVLWIGPRPILGGDIRSLSVASDIAEQISAQYPATLPALQTRMDDAFAKAASAAGIPYLSSREAIKAILPQEAMIDGKLTFRDQDHWSEFGGTVFGKRLMAALAAAGYADSAPTASSAQP